MSDEVKADDSSGMPQRKKLTPKRLIFQLLAWAVTFGILYWLFAIKLPQEIDVSQVWATLGDLSVGQIAALIVAGSITIVVVGWTAAAVLPGLPIGRGTQASVVGQLTSVALPPPADLIIRFGMYRTYGFTNDRSAVAVVWAGVARYFTVVAMPIIGLVAVILTGDNKQGAIWWLLGGVAIFGVAWWLMGRIVSNEKFAHAFGRWLERVVSRVVGWFKKTPPKDLENSVVDFSRKTRDVAVNHVKSVSASNLAWGFSCFLVFFLSARFVGLTSKDLTWSQALLITGAMLLLNAFPITPGGVGVTEAILMSVINFPSHDAEAAFAAALLLYRVFTWVMPFPIGAVAYVVWRIEVRSGRLQSIVRHKERAEPA